MTWAYSPAYGRSVFLGPAQRDVLRVAHDLTANGRRPELTLSRLAELAVRPVSSVRTALGRLRALGILGVSATPGCHGSHRLWRVTAHAARSLGARAQRVAVARIIRRWYGGITKAVAAVNPLWPALSSPLDPPQSRDDDDATPDGRAPTPEAPDPFGVKPSSWKPRGDWKPPEGETFRETLERLGGPLGSWVDEKRHGR